VAGQLAINQHRVEGFPLQAIKCRRAVVRRAHAETELEQHAAHHQLIDAVVIHQQHRAILRRTAAFVQRVRVINMPADVRWRVVGLQAPVRLELEGAGPMGIGLRAEYGIEQHGSGSTVSGRMEFKGAAVTMVGPQLETEVGNSLRGSLAKLKARVEA